MANNRRSFIKKITTSSLLTLGSIEALAEESKDDFFLPDDSENDFAVSSNDEAYWSRVRKQFTLSADCINLNSGNISPAPKVVQKAIIQQLEYCNLAPSLNMLRILEQNREQLVANLANFAGCQPDEIVINRNASEGLQTIIFGLPLQKNDEVILCKYDYPHLIDAWKQRELRDGIKLVWVDIKLPSEDENYLIHAFTDLFTPKTKLVNLTHIINWNGQILPVKKIISEAGKKGILTLVDAAHSFALLPQKITDYGCDYLVASLHKWLYAPTGTGLLYVKKERIKNLYPLFSNSNPQSETIDKFTHLGTRPMYMDHAINQAITFNNAIGQEKKQARLQFLKNYWMEKIAHIPGVKFQTSANNIWSTAMANVYVEGATAYELDAFLFANYKIHAVSINREKITSLRITPNVFTSVKELDLLAEGIENFAKNNR